MSRTSVDVATGGLLVGGSPVFPIGLSDPPPLDRPAPDGGPAWAEIATAGVNFCRHFATWTSGSAGEELPDLVRALDAARSHDLQLWVALQGIDADLSHRPLLDEVVGAVKGHPGLGVWKGADEPAHSRLPAAGLVSVYRHLRSLDPDHVVAMIEAPRDPSPGPNRPDRPLTESAVRPYAAACDIHGVDIYPVSVPPGLHAGGPPVNTDISVVGDVTRLVAAASRPKPVWTTLQIAWSGVLPPHRTVFPTLQQARFMAYDAIVAGARGLFFFGGQLLQAMSPEDQRRGWNWTYWDAVQRPLVEELAGPQHRRALLAASAPFVVEADSSQIATAAREDGDSIYLIAARTSATAGGRVTFTGLPRTLGNGTVLAHGPGNPARPVVARDGAFTDPSPYRAHNARVYHFPRG